MIKFKNPATRMKPTSAFVFFLFTALFSFSDSKAFQLDWKGQFRSEAIYLKNPSMDSSDAALGVDSARVTTPGDPSAARGYYAPGTGNKTAEFQTLFMRLMPSAIVNDNVSIHSEFWLGSPTHQFFGSGFNSQQNRHYSTFSSGSAITAQRFYADLISDFGVLTIGRAPSQWGLGLVWNNGNDLWSRYYTTGDTVRLHSKFGLFSLSPSIIKYKTGNNVGGAISAGGIVSDGTQSFSDYSLGLVYDNLDEDFKGGVNFIRRISGSRSDVAGMGVASGDVNYTIWDIFAQKKIGRVTFSGEAPIATGKIAGTNYKSFALAAEIKYQNNEYLVTELKLGMAPGQSNSSSGTTDIYRMFTFHPNYKIAMIMFNYQLANFAKDQSSGANSIYDHPITNATYLKFGMDYRLDKWNVGFDFTWAQASVAAESGQSYFHQFRNQYEANAGGSQSKDLGKELDLHARLNWDDFTSIGFELGWYMPGKFYEFSNVAGVNNATDSVIAAGINLGIKF